MFPSRRSHLGWCGGGMYIHKGVTERFGFDDSRISQIQYSLSRIMCWFLCCIYWLREWYI